MNKIAGSFRDPSGFLFWEENILRRSIAPSYFPNYEHLISSGLYKNLTDKKWLIPHSEDLLLSSSSQKIIIPTLIPFISYPYEWSFSQLKDAALLTLKILTESLH